MHSSVRFLMIALALAANAGHAQSIESLDAQARAAYNAKDYKRAAALSVQIYEAKLKASGGRENFELATAALNAGQSLHKAGKDKEAIPYINTACRIGAAVRGEKSREEATCLMIAVEVTADAGDISAAKSLADRTLGAVAASMPKGGLAAANFHLGEIFRNAGAPTEAAGYFAEGARMYRPENLNDSESLIESLAQQGEAAYDAGEYAAAAKVLEEAIALESKQAPATSATVISKVYLAADCYRRMGEFDKAITALQKVAAALKNVTAAGHVSAEEILLQIAERENDAGGSSEALATLEDVIQRVERAGTQEAAAFKIAALDLSGRIQTEQHDYAGAERAFEAELETANTDASARSQALQGLGFFLLKRGRYAEARTRLDQALAELEKKTPDSLEVAAILEQIAVALLNANDCEEANPLIERATAIYAKQTPKSREMVRSLKLASVCAATDEAKTGKMETALDLQLQVEHGISADLLIDTARNFERQGKMDAAKRSAGIALELDPGSVVGKDTLASILESTGETAAAVKALRESSELAAKKYGEDSINVAARRFNLGHALLRNGDVAGGREAFLTAARSFGGHADGQLRMLSIGEQRQVILSQTAIQTSALLSVCRDQKCLGEAYELMAPWKGLLMDGLRREIAFTGGRGQDEAALARWKTLRSELSKWSSARSSVAEEQWRPRADELVREKEAVERTLLAGTAAADRPAITLASLQSALHEDEVLVDVYQFDLYGKSKMSDSKYGAVITAHSGAPRFVDLGPAENVNAVVLAWLSNLGVTSDAAWNSLRQTVWEPIRKMLAPAIRRVRVSPDGELVRIPWHQMELNEGERLMEVAEVDSARSLVYLRAQTSRGKVAKLLVVGGLDYDAGRTKESPGVPGSPFKQLTLAEPESEAVVDLGRRNGFSPALLTREKAGKAAVLAGLGDAAYVHFATHGFANGEPERGLSGRSWSVGTRPHFARDPLIDSGLALSGANVRDRNTLVTEGVLSAEDLLDSDLSRSWMVVLSACDTGLGLTTPTQGVMGLRSALSAAGATKLLVSLWSVDDEATKILMTEFYTGLWVQKLPLVEALHAAQGKVRDDARFRAPRFWAGWVVIDAD